MPDCWEDRGCDEAMQADCPHSAVIGDRCPTKCAFAGCDRAAYELTTDPALIFEPEIDRMAAIKETCTYCAFFLTHGPRLGRTVSGRGDLR